MLNSDAFAQQGVATNAVLTPNKEIQAFLRSLLSPNEREMFAGTQDQLTTRLEQLKRVAEREECNLVVELLHFSMQSESMREGMLPGVLIEQLKISKENIARGLIPILDTDDQGLREKCRNWLGEVEANDSVQGPDFSIYESIIRGNKTNVPRGLTMHMYDTDAETALRSFASVYLEEAEAEALADSVRARDDAESLDQLSRRADWWAQLYVIEKMRKNPQLRSAVVLERLSKSRDTLVQESIRDLEQTDLE